MPIRSFRFIVIPWYLPSPNASGQRIDGERWSILLVLTAYLATDLFNIDFYSNRDWFYFLDHSIINCRYQKNQNDSDNCIFGRRRWFNALFWCDRINVKSVLVKVWIKRFVTTFLSHSAFYICANNMFGVNKANYQHNPHVTSSRMLSKSQALGWWKLVVL